MYRPVRWRHFYLFPGALVCMKLTKKLINHAYKNVFIIYICLFSVCMSGEYLCAMTEVVANGPLVVLLFHHVGSRHQDLYPRYCLYSLSHLSGPHVPCSGHLVYYNLLSHLLSSQPVPPWLIPEQSLWATHAPMKHIVALQCAGCHLKLCSPQAKTKKRLTSFYIPSSK